MATIVDNQINNPENTSNSTSRVETKSSKTQLNEMLIRAFVNPIENVFDSNQKSAAQHTINLIAFALSNAETYGIDLDKLQIGPLRQMTELLMVNVPRNQIPYLLPNIISMMIYYLGEKGGDDGSVILAKEEAVKLGIKGERLKYPEIMNAHNQAIIELFKGKISLNDAIHRLDGYSFEGLETDIGGALSQISEALLEEYISANNLNKEDEMALRGFFEDPNITILKINIVAAYIARDYVLRVSDPDLNELVTFTNEGFINRYTVVQAINNDMSGSIEKAVNLGIPSILTITTFGSYLLFAVDADIKTGGTELKEKIARNQELIIDVIKESSFAIRALNDAGATLQQPERTIEVIRELRQYPDLIKLSPREFFASLSSKFDDPQVGVSGKDLRLHLLSRFIKDSEENEYNMILSSGLTGSESVEEQWEIFFSNFNFLVQKFTEVIPVLFPKLKYLINEEGIEPVRKIRDFVNSNFMLYSILHGDYDESLPGVKETTPGTRVYETSEGAIVVEYDPFDDFTDIVEIILKEPNNVIKATVKVNDLMINKARELHPYVDIVQIKMTEVIRWILKFAFGEQYEDIPELFFAVSAKAIRLFMDNPHEFDKTDGDVGAMGRTMSGLHDDGEEGTGYEQVTASMEDWENLSGPVSPFLRGKFLQLQAKRMQEQLEKYLLQTDEEGYLEIDSDDMMGETFELIMQLLVDGYSPDMHTRQHDLKNLGHLIHDVSSMTFERLPIKDITAREYLRNDKMVSLAEKFTDFYNRVILANHHGTEDNGEHILPTLMNDEFYQAHAGRDQSEAISVVEAGHKTVAQVTMRALLAFAEDENLWNEVQSVLDSGSKAEQNEIFRDMIKESARVEPPVYFTFRGATKPTELLGLKFQKKSIVVLDLLHALADPTYYDAPNEFRLHRADPDNRAFMPWLEPKDKVRGCVGLAYSLVVISVAYRFFSENFERPEVMTKGEMHIDASRHQVIRLRFKKKASKQSDVLREQASD